MPQTHCWNSFAALNCEHRESIESRMEILRYAFLQPYIVIIPMFLLDKTTKNRPHIRQASVSSSCRSNNHQQSGRTTPQHQKLTNYIKQIHIYHIIINIYLEKKLMIYCFVRWAEWYTFANHTNMIAAYILPMQESDSPTRRSDHRRT